MGGVQKWTIVAQYASNMKLSLRPHVVTDFVSLVSYRLILEFANDWQQKGPENTKLLIFRPKKYFLSLRLGFVWKKKLENLFVIQLFFRFGRAVGSLLLSDVPSAAV